LRLPLAHWRVVGLLGLAGAAGALALLRARTPADPLQRERERQRRLGRIGRIVEGTIVEVIEPAEGAGERRGGRWVVYRYTIAGVTYEAAQEIADPVLPLLSGQTASVRYDPANPGNSILVADPFSGVRA
jgi:hypothetical protein